MNKYDLIVVPVVNEENILVGRITVDDIIDVVKDEAEKDYQMAQVLRMMLSPLIVFGEITRSKITLSFLIGLFGGLIGVK